MTDYDARGYGVRFKASRPLDEETTRTWVDLLRAAAPPAPLGTVVDLGAGTGRFWPVLRLAWRPSTIVAIERSAGMLDAAPDASDIDALQADLDGGEIDTLQADAIFCSMALHYSHDPAALCVRLLAMLREGGVLCVRTATHETVRENLLLHSFPTAHRAELRAFPSRATIEGWLADAGFDVRSQLVETAAAPSYWRYVRRAARRGVPSLQLVPWPEFTVGLVSLAVRAGFRAARRVPLPADRTLLVVGTRL